MKKKKIIWQNLEKVPMIQSLVSKKKKKKEKEKEKKRINLLNKYIIPKEKKQ